jgi:hypothetical protein
MNMERGVSCKRSWALSVVDKGVPSSERRDAERRHPYTSAAAHGITRQLLISGLPSVT